LTRHELKEQLQHDHFRDAVSDAVVYAQGHRQLLIRWAIVAIAILVLAGGAFWYSSYRSGLRQQDLQAAFVVLETPVGSDNPGAKSFPTEQAKREASMKALASVVAKDGGTREGLTAQYYLGTLKAQAGDAKGAEADLKSVANSSDRCAALAKIALAQLYSGQSRIPEAQSVLRELVNKPTDLVSKAQAQILLAHLDETANPQEAKRIVQSLKTPNQDPAVTHALDQISSQQAK
jgi:hypothetical protein